MEIVVGAAPRIGSAKSAGYAGSGTSAIEAKVLNVRPSRKRSSVPIKKERRFRKTSADSQNGKIMMLFIADNQYLPKDLNTDKYKVVLRFIPKRK